jgi:hypothetical protein
MVGELQAGDPLWVGPYRLVGRLGSGGMAQVFLGRSDTGTLAAVKVIHPELAGEVGFRERFAREVACAANVSGQFTALVLDADVQSATPWLATAYVAGPSLAEAVAMQGPLPVPVVLTLAVGLAQGLGAIHAAGVVHRDLKPDNVLLASDGPRVIDFGISRSREAGLLTQAGMVVGSPGFMSPEQARGRNVGPPSDVFSLGAVLAFAATGTQPFGTGTPPMLMSRVVHHEPDLSGLPAPVWPLVAWCLAKDPGRRPSTSQLLALLGGARRAAPRAYRHRIPAAGPAAVAAAARAPAAPAAALAAALGRRRARRHLVRAGALAGFMGAAALTVMVAVLPGALRGAAAAQPQVEFQAGPAPASSAGPPAQTVAPPARPSSAVPAARSLAAGAAARPAHPSALVPATASPPPGTAPASPPVPQIITAITFTLGRLVYVRLTYADPGNDAAGFGFVGVDGARWAAESHPFTNPSGGAVSAGTVSGGTVAYAFDLGCGLARPVPSSVEAWIYDTTGARSQPVTITLTCAS